MSIPSRSYADVICRYAGPFPFGCRKARSRLPNLLGSSLGAGGSRRRDYAFQAQHGAGSASYPALADYSAGLDCAINKPVDIFRTQNRGLVRGAHNALPSAYPQAGAGIVADSVPGREYEECQNKARAVLRAFELAEKGL